MFLVHIWIPNDLILSCIHIQLYIYATIDIHICNYTYITYMDIQLCASLHLREFSIITGPQHWWKTGGRDGRHPAGHRIRAVPSGTATRCGLWPWHGHGMCWAPNIIKSWELRRTDFSQDFKIASCFIL